MAKRWSDLTKAQQSALDRHIHIHPTAWVNVTIYGLSRTARGLAAAGLLKVRRRPGGKGYEGRLTRAGRQVWAR